MQEQGMLSSVKLLYSKSLIFKKILKILFQSYGKHQYFDKNCEKASMQMIIEI